MRLYLTMCVRCALTDVHWCAGLSAVSFWMCYLLKVRILLNCVRWDKERLMERLYTGDQEAFFAEAQVTSCMYNLTRHLSPNCEYFRRWSPHSEGRGTSKVVFWSQRSQERSVWSAAAAFQGSLWEACNVVISTAAIAGQGSIPPEIPIVIGFN